MGGLWPPMRRPPQGRPVRSKGSKLPGARGPDLRRGRWPPQCCCPAGCTRAEPSLRWNGLEAIAPWPRTAPSGGRSGQGHGPLEAVEATQGKSREMCRSGTASDSQPWEMLGLHEGAEPDIRRAKLPATSRSYELLDGGVRKVSRGNRERPPQAHHHLGASSLSLRRLGTSRRRPEHTLGGASRDRPIRAGKGGGPPAAGPRAPRPAGLGPKGPVLGHFGHAGWAPPRPPPGVKNSQRAGWKPDRKIYFYIFFWGGPESGPGGRSRRGVASMAATPQRERHLSRR